MVAGSVKCFFSGRPGNGNYANVYVKTDKEGSYTWRFTVTGNLSDGSPFSRVITLSKWVGVNVDPLQSNVSVIYNLAALSGYKAAQVFIKPVDKNGEFLGPLGYSA